MFEVNVFKCEFDNGGTGFEATGAITGSGCFWKDREYCKYSGDLKTLAGDIVENARTLYNNGHLSRWDSSIRIIVSTNVEIFAPMEARARIRRPLSGEEVMELYSYIIFHSKKSSSKPEAA